jgi:class 3 adenylate cyclase
MRPATNDIEAESLPHLAMLLSGSGYRGAPARIASSGAVADGRCMAASSPAGRRREERMIELPRGTVTFLLTDVEGSSALWEQAPEAMHAALARHDALFEQIVGAHRGFHIRPRGEGDSRFAVFAGALDAVSAALAFQRALATEAWPLPRPLTIRAGLHSGHAEVRDGDYYGQAVNRCARIRDVGRGGETLLSDATVAVVRDDLPPRFAVRHLGERRLRGLARPEQLFRLVDSPEAPTGALRRWIRRLRQRPWPRRRQMVPSVLLFAAVVMGLSVAFAQWLGASEVILLSDDFEDGTRHALPDTSVYPNEFAVSYGGGEYTIQTISLTSGRLPSVVVPGWYEDASLAVDVRVIGNTDVQSIVLGCRNAAPRSGYRLTFRPGQGTGSLDRTDDVPVLIRLAPLTNGGSVRRLTAANRVALKCVGSTISATINGTEVASARDTTYAAGRMWIGATVDPGVIAFGHAFFDNLTIRGTSTPAVVAQQPAEQMELPADVASEAN